MTGFVRKGAQALAIITNDGWWGKTAGRMQHFSYSSIRAIVRCANTGISGFINQKGDVVSRTVWWAPEVQRGTLSLTEYKTPFVKYGDVVGRICVFSSLLLLLALIVRFFTRRK